MTLFERGRDQRWSSLFLLFVLVCHASAVNIGFITTESDTSGSEVEFFRSSVVNCSTGSSSVPLFPATRVISANAGPTAVSDAACSLLDEGVSTIVDATANARESATVCAFCQKHDVPCFVTKVAATKKANEKRQNSAVFNMIPDKDMISSASLSVLDGMSWRSIIFVYDSLDHLAFAEKILADESFSVKLIKLEDVSSYRTALDSMVSTSTPRVVLALNSHHMHRLLQLLELHLTKPSLLSSPKFFVPTLETEEARLQELSRASGGSPVYALQLLPSEETPASSRQIESRAVEAAVQVAQQAMEATGLGNEGQEESGLCSAGKTWEDGSIILNEIHKGNFSGMTGSVHFSSSGARSDVFISVVRINSDETIHEVASWSSTDGKMQLPAEATIISQELRSTRQAAVQTTLRVTGILNDPYIMAKEDGQEWSDNDRYEGFCIDLLDELAEILKFDYQIEVVADGNYGRYDQNTGEWTGMIGEIVHQRADIAIGDISVTPQRRAAVDFTDAWRFFGIGLLYRAPMSAGQFAHWFGFLDPFSVDIWVYSLVSCFVVAVLLFIISRLSPCERNPPPKEDWTPFSLFNSLWWALATLTRQFVVQQPRAASTRVLSLVWWLTVIVLVSAYISNYSAIRTSVSSSAQSSPISSIYDLPLQRKVKYGAMYGGSTWAFFENSKSESLQRVFSGMKNQALTGKIKSNMEGMTNVINSYGKFAFLMEEPTIEYIVERRCDLVQVGGSVASRSYAIALRKGSPYLDHFNDALFSLRNSGKLEELRKKWWSEKRGGGQCPNYEEDDSGYATQMTMEDLAGVFIILAGGAGVAIILALFECCWRSAALAREKDETFCGELALQAQEAVSAPFDKEELA